MYKTRQSTTESAILVGVVLPDHTQWEVKDSLDELELLADTAGADVTDRVTQSLTSLRPATYIGSGKVRELKALVAQRETDLVIFDDELAPNQMRNLEKALGCKLVDRSGLILDIFASRAKTAMAKAQVEVAQLDYLRSRLTRYWTHLSRQKGGIGTKGPGETQIETDRRLIDKRIATLEEQLEKYDKQRTTQRKGRWDNTTVSLVGYTNAGKSTLMNALAEADVFAENRLFATLDATTRQVYLDSNKQILLSDTVGFIRKLPHRLIESFKSTLDEVRESDALLHVIDVTHPRLEDHIRVVNETLKELDSLDKPTLMVFNKADALKEKGLLASLKKEYPEAVFVSALRSIGLDRLKERLLDVIEEDFIERTAYLPVTEAKAVSHIHDVADVLSQEYMYARDSRHFNGSPDEPQAVVRLHFRSARKHDKELAGMLEHFAGLQPVDEPAEQERARASGE